VASIIKSTDRNASFAAPAFNFDDMSNRAETYLKQVRADAAKLLGDAHREAEKIRKQAEIEGLKAAQKQLQAQAEAAAAKRMETVLPALRTAIAEWRNVRQAWLGHWEATGIRLATRIAERILRRELKSDPTLPVALVRESLELAVGDDGVRVLLNPQDVERLGPQVQAVIAELKPTGRPEVVADARIEVGGCRVETRFGAIDQQLSTQLRRIEEELL
jgi:flagellar assembly protein FliH